MTYNGWKNYETWSVALIIDNDEGTYSYSRELVASTKADHGDDDASAIASDVAEVLKGFVEDAMIPELPDHMLASQLLSAAMSEVDWYEIAENYLSELDD